MRVPLPGAAWIINLATENRHPLAHAYQAESGAMGATGVETNSSVLDLESNVLLTTDEPDAGLLRTAVPGDVVQR